MRNLKKFLALVLAMLMIVSAGAAVSAFDDVAADNQYAAAIDKLAGYGIVNGTGEGVFSPDDGVERFQMAIMMARALKPNETNWNDGMAIFEDVDEWYGAIAYAYVNKIVNGVSENPMLFAPHDPITYAQALTMAVRALGYTVENGNPWWLPAYTKATELGLTNNMAASIKADDALTRAECAQIIANMLAAKPADGGATIEAKNFGIATPDNTTICVITATPKQAYAEGYKVAEAGYVGVQIIENGVPAGSIIYVPIADLGIDAADVEKYFNYTVNLVNFDEATDKYEKAVIGADPTVVYSKDVKRDGDKLIVDNRTYYTVEQVAGSAIKNEIVVFCDASFTESAKILLLDKDGNIVNSDGTIVATYAYSTPSGAKYYVDKDVTGGATKVISAEEATAKYGVIVSDSSYTKYTPVKASAIGGNALISLFDDNNDEKFDRAVYTPIYLAAYNGKDTKISGVNDKTKFVGATLAKGDVFVGTYNVQTNTVSVIEVLDLQYGVMNYLVTGKYNGDGGNNWTATVDITVDGSRKTFTVGNEKQTIGANLVVSGDKPTAVAHVYNDARLGWTNNELSTSNLIAGFAKAGSPVRFYEYNGYIIVLEAYNIAEKFDRMLITDVTSWDTEAVYVDAYVNGVRGEYAITTVDDVVLKNANSFKVSAIVSNLYKEVEKTARLYKAVANGDSYMIGKAFDDKDADDFNLQKMGSSFTFLNDGTTGSGANALRTNSKTVFFFIDNANGNVTTYTGTPKSGWSVEKANLIYTDKLGYGDNATAKYDNGVGKFGVASCVYVYYNSTTTINGFGIKENTESIVYVPATPTPTDFRSAAELGLKGYSGKTFVVYGKVSVNMKTGEYVEKLYVDPNATLVGGNFYKVDYQGVAEIIKADEYAAKGIQVKETVTSYKDTDMSKWVNINTDKAVAADANQINKVVTVKSDKLESNGALKKDQVVTYISLGDKKVDNHTIVLIVGGKPVEPEKPEAGIANASYTFEGNTYGAIYDSEKDTVALYDDGDRGSAVTKPSTGSANASSKYTVAIEKLDGAQFVKAYEGAEIDAKYENGVLTINGFYTAGKVLPITLDNGTYKVTVTFTIINENDCVVTYFPTIS